MEYYEIRNEWGDVKAKEFDLTSAQWRFKKLKGEFKFSSLSLYRVVCGKAEKIA